MRASFTFRGYCELTRLKTRNIGRVEFDGEESKAYIQVGQRKNFKGDVPVKVTVTIERVTKKREVNK